MTLSLNDTVTEMTYVKHLLIGIVGGNGKQINQLKGFGMRKLLLAAAGAFALVGATTASAAVVVSPTTNPASLAALTPPATFSIATNLSGGPGTFTTDYDFTILGAPAFFNGQISSVPGDGGAQTITFDAPTLLSGSTTLYTFVQDAGNVNTWAITPANSQFLMPGTYTIRVGGNLLTNIASYGGNFNVNPAVPEPKTWAMMLLGFGAMGLAIRRRRKPVLAQLA